MKIRWLDLAIRDLIEVRRYIEEDDPIAAQAVAEQITRAVRLLADFPAAGRPGRVPNTRELVVAGTPYILPYRVRSGTIQIMRVFHGARKWNLE